MGKSKKDIATETSSKEENITDKDKTKKKKKVEDEPVKKIDTSNKKKESKKIPSDDDDTDNDGDSKPQPKKGGFALLMDAESGDSTSDHESDNDDVDDDDESDEDDNLKKPAQKKMPPKKEAVQEKGNKKGKKSKKKKDDSDDDLDKVLAELQIEYTGKKPTTTNKAEGDTNKEDGSGQTLVDNEDAAAKSAAQKKKEKKEKQKAAKQERKDPVTVKIENPEPIEENPTEDNEELEKDADGTGDKKKKKKKGEKEKEDKLKKGPAKKAIAAMQETLKKMKEEEERARLEEEERIRQEEEKELQRLEQIRLEKEKKERKKKKEKERIERMKAEGKYLTPKQKADKARAMAMIESLQKMSGGIPGESVERKPRLGTRIKPGKLKKQMSGEGAANEDQKSSTPQVDVKIIDSKTETKVSSVETKEGEIKDSWDAESSSSEEEETDTKTKSEKSTIAKAQTKKESSSSESSDSDDESEEEDSGSADLTDSKAKEEALDRIKKRQVENEEKKSASNLRAAIVCVLGHVDTGKTKILDKLRRTNVQDGEAGGITQQIGATNVPIENIKEQTRHVKGVNDIKFEIPGLLIIDTPGHESFSNLRSRGSSLCDIAILVVDIMHGLEPQTIESLNLLKARKTPFIVALNKIDRLYDWQSSQRKDVRDIIKSQHTNTQNEFETRTKEVILQFSEQGLNSALFYENPDVRTYVSLVPTSAITGEGMGNLLSLIIQSCETLLHKKLQFSHTLQATVLEVKAISGLGTTIDAILINGTLREGDTIVLAGTDGPIVTQIRSILMPQPMKELRVKNAYVEYKEVVAAQGVKIAAKDLEKAVAGLNLQVAHKSDEIDVLKDEVAKELKSALSSIKLSDRGVYVQASTLGSLEALLEFLKGSKIPYSAIRIGPVVKRDVMKASAMLEHESQYAVILAFDVKVERDAQEMADSVGVTIFQADIIYHLFDKFMAHREALKQRKREEFKHIAVFPCKLKILPQYVFNSRDPIVMGVQIEAGIVKEGTPICVPGKDFVDIGVVTSIESNHKQVETARKGQEVCIKIDPIPGEAPKMFGRHFDETDFLVSKISRQSIDACKDYFRDDLVKTDWQLMVELKNLFQIL